MFMLACYRRIVAISVSIMFISAMEKAAQAAPGESRTFNMVKGAPARARARFPFNPPPPEFSF